MSAPTPRRMWEVLEPFHAVTYFAPESKAATDTLGCKGYWMSYFGLRAAPLGAVPPEVVIATFYNFHPDRVRRAVPDVWSVASPEQFIATRLSSVDTALRRLLGDAVGSPEMTEAASIAKAAASEAQIAGRPLAAANVALDWPTDPHLVLWHAQTILRESRGDAHIAALVAAELDPCEALVAFAAEGRVERERVQTSRAWSDDEWAQAESRLRDRTLLDDDAQLTDAGRRVREWVEERTDATAQVPWRAIGAERTARLESLALPLIHRIADHDGFMAGNPMGLPLAK